MTLEIPMWLVGVVIGFGYVLGAGAIMYSYILGMELARKTYTTFAATEDSQGERAAFAICLLFCWLLSPVGFLLYGILRLLTFPITRGKL